MSCGVDERLKLIKAQVCLQDLDRPCGLARIHQDLTESMVDKIGVEREGSLEFGDGGVVLAIPQQDVSKLATGLWQAGVEVHRHLRRFKGAIERSGTEIVSIVRVDILTEVSPGQHRSGARIIRVDRQTLFEQTPSVIERCIRASAQM